MTSKPFLILLSLIALGGQAFATPAQIVIIRHGEKPDDNKDNQLSPQGCERAYLLAESAFIKSLPRPVAIYASAPDDVGGSVRPVDTILPTAQKMWSMPVLDPFTRLEYGTVTPSTPATVTQTIMSNPAYDGQTVVMAWEHDAIPPLAASFGYKLVPGVTDSWPDWVFDEAWVLSFDASGALSKFDIVPENVLPGDNTLGGTDAWRNKPGPLDASKIPADIAAECANDDAIDALSAQPGAVRPPLPTKKKK